VAEVGDVQIRNRGTVGGALAHADPASDYLPYTATMDASFVLRSADGRRTVDAADFFTGYMETALEEGELLTGVQIPEPDEGTVVGFDKFSKRESDWAIVNAAVRLQRDEKQWTDARIRVGGVGGAPRPAHEAEAKIEGTPVGKIDPETVGNLARSEIDPDEDPRMSEAYKRDLVRATVMDALESME